MVDVSCVGWTLVEAEGGHSRAAVACPDRDCSPSIRLRIRNGDKNNSASREVKRGNLTR